MARPRTADDLINAELLQLNNALASHFNSDVMIVKSPMRFGLDDIIRTEIENLHLNGSHRAGQLTVLIETTGGFIEVVERIYRVLRKHYNLVDFIIPNYAYSAGTVLVLSADKIYMDYYSVLGPIDPQMPNENDRFVSGLGYLAKYEELVKTINSASSPDDVRAELAYLLRKFDPAELFDLEQARNHSEDLLVEWLSKHKFKDWIETETNKASVDDAHRKAQASKIAKILGNPERWHSHGRGIGLRELTSDEIGLKIVNFGDDDTLNGHIRTYYEVFMDFCKVRNLSGDGQTVVHCRNGIRRG